MQKIIKQALKYPNQYAGSFIALLMYTGVRKMELLTAKWQHLDKAKRKLYVPMTKNGNSREVYLSDDMMKVICALPKQSNNPYIFSSMVTGKHMTESFMVEALGSDYVCGSGITKIRGLLLDMY
ncbi:MAG: tyrosine-type recombinase/integrase, partial [Colwellia sp.]|nr:tyrosine-type recombinase/integrase [Colwellia sp.]